MVVGLCGCCAWGELALVLPFVPFPKAVMTKMSTAGTSKIRGCFIWAVLSLLLEQTNVRLTVKLSEPYRGRESGGTRLFAR
jgi:hypothetical protein